MHYTYNSSKLRIDIVTATGLVLAFIEAKYFDSYPYFAWLLENENF